MGTRLRRFIFKKRSPRSACASTQTDDSVDPGKTALVSNFVRLLSLAGIILITYNNSILRLSVFYMATIVRSV